ncbi:hypothetical protein ACEPPN_006912 [Leptodophora sp. 'Broadleaf-Isolate-01']
MASSADIIPLMGSLDLGPSPDPSNRKTGSTKAKTKTTKSQPKPKSQPVKANPINVPKGPSGSQSSKPQPPKLQPERPTVYPRYTPLQPPPTSIDRADGGKMYQFQARAEPGAVPASPKKNRRSPRNRTTRSNSALIATQAPLSSKPLSSSVLPKREAKPSLQEFIEKVPQQTFRYVVQASGGSESSEAIVGVYSKLEGANECAKGYVGRWGVGKSEIVDIQSSIGCTARARRRSWQGGMSEIRVGGAWVKVLPKEFIASGGDRETYLAVDRSGGLFVIGVFAEQEPAWAACKKYRDQLAYCFELEGKEQWLDGEGMFHSKGTIGGKSHHWFVVQYPLDGNV